MAAKGPIRGDLWQANSILNAVAAVSSVSVAGSDEESRAVTRWQPR